MALLGHLKGRGIDINANRRSIVTYAIVGFDKRLVLTADTVGLLVRPGLTFSCTDLWPLDSFLNP
jgi:hypothetical protein